jgi:hypothetical protein
LIKPSNFGNLSLHLNKNKGKEKIIVKSGLSLNTCEKRRRDEKYETNVQDNDTKKHMLPPKSNINTCKFCLKKSFQIQPNIYYQTKSKKIKK